MGRRKIEIQPITHERNRSVTFLKRKNGLFKKAYELGVLCSVEVAVIILEDRPGHETKLHTYSSSNIRNIVQRQNRFQGEQDSRGPGDFSGAAAGKFDEDDDEEDVIDEPLQKRLSKRKVASKAELTIPPDVAISPEYIPQPHPNGLPHFQYLAMSRGTYGDGSSIGSLMPVSNDRVSNLRSSSRASKRPRISDSVPSRSRSSSIDHERLYLLGDAQKMSTKRHLQNPYGPGESRDSYCPQRQHGSLFNMGGPAGPMDIGPPPPRFEPQYDPALYQHQFPPSMIRQASGSALGSRDGDNGVQSRDGQPQGITPRERGGEMFAAFLEADERSRQMAAAAEAVAQGQQEQLNWSAASNQMSKGTARSVHHVVGTTTDNWFDLFSGPSVSTSKCSEPPNKSNIHWSEIGDIGADIARILAAKSSTASSTVQVAGAGRAGAGAEKRGKSTDSEEVVMHRRVQVVADEAEKDAEGEDDVDVVGDGGLQADTANISIESSKDRKEKQTRNISHDVNGTKTRAERTRQKIVTTSSRGRGKGKRGC